MRFSGGHRSKEEENGPTDSETPGPLCLYSVSPAFVFPECRRLGNRSTLMRARTQEEVLLQSTLGGALFRQPRCAEMCCRRVFPFRLSEIKFWGALPNGGGGKLSAGGAEVQCRLGHCLVVVQHARIVVHILKIRDRLTIYCLSLCRYTFNCNDGYAALQ